MEGYSATLGALHITINTECTTRDCDYFSQLFTARGLDPGSLTNCRDMYPPSPPPLAHGGGWHKTHSKRNKGADVPSPPPTPPFNMPHLPPPPPPPPEIEDGGNGTPKAGTAAPVSTMSLLGLFHQHHHAPLQTTPKTKAPVAAHHHAPNTHSHSPGIWAAVASHSHSPHNHAPSDTGTPEKHVTVSSSMEPKPLQSQQESPSPPPPPPPPPPLPLPTSWSPPPRAVKGASLPETIATRPAPQATPMASPAAADIAHLAAAADAVNLKRSNSVEQRSAGKLAVLSTEGQAAVEGAVMPKGDAAYLFPLFAFGMLAFGFVLYDVRAVRRPRHATETTSSTGVRYARTAHRVDILSSPDGVRDPGQEEGGIDAPLSAGEKRAVDLQLDGSYTL